MLLVLVHFLHCQDCLWTYRGNNILSGRVLFIIPKLIYFVRQERLLMLLMSHGEEDDGSCGGGEKSTVCFDMSSKQFSFTLFQHFHLNYLKTYLLTCEYLFTDGMHQMHLWSGTPTHSHHIPNTTSYFQTLVCMHLKY